MPMPQKHRCHLTVLASVRQDRAAGRDLVSKEMAPPLAAAWGRDLAQVMVWAQVMPERLVMA